MQLTSSSPLSTPLAPTCWFFVASPFPPDPSSQTMTSASCKSASFVPRTTSKRVLLVTLPARREEVTKREETMLWRGEQGLESPSCRRLWPCLVGRGHSFVEVVCGEPAVLTSALFARVSSAVWWRQTRLPSSLETIPEPKPLRQNLRISAAFSMWHSGSSSSSYLRVPHHSGLWLIISSKWKLWTGSRATRRLQGGLAYAK